MSNVRFISDYHFSHEFMASKRGFKDIWEMNDHIVKEHNKVVHKKDITYILGDITMHKPEYYFYLDQMNGRKKVILGNHDLPQHVPELLKYVEQVGSIVKYKGIFLTHVPIHPQELEYRVPYNIHGHVHENNVKLNITKGSRGSIGKYDPRYINVSCEMIDYKPKTLEELLPGYLSKRKK